MEFKVMTAYEAVEASTTKAFAVILLLNAVVFLFSAVMS